MDPIEHSWTLDHLTSQRVIQHTLNSGFNIWINVIRQPLLKLLLDQRWFLFTSCLKLIFSQFLLPINRDYTTSRSQYLSNSTYGNWPQARYIEEGKRERVRVCFTWEQHFFKNDWSSKPVASVETWTWLHHLPINCATHTNSTYLALFESHWLSAYLPASLCRIVSLELKFHKIWLHLYLSDCLNLPECPHNTLDWQSSSLPSSELTTTIF